MNKPMFVAIAALSSATVLRGMLLLAIAGMIAGCGGAPEPAVPVGAHGSASLATQTWQRGSFPVDQTLYVDCLGEYVRFTGKVSYQYHHITTSSGVVNFDYMILPATPNQPFQAVGQTSGTVYSSRGSPDTTVSHSAAAQTFTFRDRETYMAASGQWFVLASLVHTTVNADGRLTAAKIEDYAFTCH